MDRLAPDARDRLVKLLGMLGSAHAGERAAAGLKAHELLQQHGLTWTEVLGQRAPALEPGRAPQPRGVEPWRRRAHACWLRSYQLNKRERAFVDGLRFWNGEPSAKQLAWLDHIHNRLIAA
jgi:hypothetical protein